MNLFICGARSAVRVEFLLQDPEYRMYVFSTSILRVRLTSHCTNQLLARSSMRYNRMANEKDFLNKYCEDTGGNKDILIKYCEEIFRFLCEKSVEVHLV